MEHSPTEIPEFMTEHLVLKGVRLLDAPAFDKYFNDYEVVRHLNAIIPWPYPAHENERYIREEILPNQGINDWAWGLFLKENPEELIGCLHLWRPGSPENRGFWLGRPFWGKGFMTEATIPTTTFAFNELGFDKLVFNNAVGNLRSRRIKEKFGARLVSISPATFIDPQFTEQEFWELTATDWFHHIAGK